MLPFTRYRCCNCAVRTVAQASLASSLPAPDARQLRIEPKIGSFSTDGLATLLQTFFDDTSKPLGGSSATLTSAPLRNHHTLHLPLAYTNHMLVSAPYSHTQGSSFSLSLSLLLPTFVPLLLFLRAAALFLRPLTYPLNFRRLAPTHYKLTHFPQTSAPPHLPRWSPRNGDNRANLDAANVNACEVENLQLSEGDA